VANRRAAPIVRAAGGVVWREVDGQVRIALVHRPRYDDWTLPKGKLGASERALSGAVREIQEEVGAQVAVSRRLPSIEYRVDDARKVVDFWTMRYIHGDFTSNHEVDELAWLSVAAARERLSHDLYGDVLDAFCAMPVPHSVIVLVRHARAGKRSEWTGDDRDRPLERAGRRQAARLADFLSYFAADRIVSADRARCVQTVELLSRRTGVPVEIAPLFSDESFVERPSAATRELLALGKPGSAVVVVSQGTAIPGLLSALPIEPPPVDVTTRKGAAWVLCFADPILLSADRYDGAGR
jgi:phosphohistidine phosphatase SixA/8-oxo-dGTP pyrophosphatase MutT (NUDIX family)